MLVENNSDAIYIDVVYRIINAETPEAMNAGFEELQILAEVRQQQFDKQVREARKKDDVPRREGEGALEAAAAEWGYQGRESPADSEGDD